MKIQYVMTQEKQTKNKVVYKNLEGAVDTIYVDKNQLQNHMEGKNEYPATLKITLEAE